MGLFPYFTEIIGKNIAFGISDLGFQARLQHLRPRFQLVADPSAGTSYFKNITSVAHGRLRDYIIVSRSQTAFFRFICGGFSATTNKNGKKRSRRIAAYFP